MKIDPNLLPTPAGSDNPEPEPFVRLGKAVDAEVETEAWLVGRLGFQVPDFGPTGIDTTSH